MSDKNVVKMFSCRIENWIKFYVKQNFSETTRALRGEVPTVGKVQYSD